MQGSRLKKSFGLHNFPVLRKHCIKNMYDSILRILAWAQEQFQKSTNAIKLSLLNEKLNCYTLSPYNPSDIPHVDIQVILCTQRIL